MTAEPPLDAGAAQETTDWPLAFEVAATPVGAPGGPDGVTAFDGADAGPVPDPLVALTVNVYAVPIVRPVAVHGDPTQAILAPPGDAVTVYPVTGAPPVDVGAVNVTVAVPPVPAKWWFTTACTGLQQVAQPWPNLSATLAVVADVHATVA